MKKFFKEFKDFIQKGNVLDLAVGIIIGTAFNKIVSSLVNDIIMPIIGLIGGKNVQEAKLTLVEAVLDNDGNIIKNAVTLNYGNFIQFIIDFLIIAFTVFIILKVVKGMRKKAESAKEVILNKIDEVKEKGKDKDTSLEDTSLEDTSLEDKAKPSTDDILLEIRDLLKEKQ